MGTLLTKRADRALLLAPEEIRTMAPAFDENLLFFLERRFLDVLPLDRMELAEPDERGGRFDFSQQSRFFRVDCITYETEVDQGMHLANMNSILASLAYNQVTVAMVIRGKRECTSLYYGLVAQDSQVSGGKLSELAVSFQKSYQAQFGSVTLVPLDADLTQNDIMIPLAGNSGNRKNINAITGIPSVRENEQGAPFVQGLDRFMESMRGEDYVLLTIANPLGLPDIDDITSRCRDLGGDIHAVVKATIQKHKSSTKSINVGAMGMVGESITKGVGFSGAGIGALIGAGLGSVIPGAGTAVGAMIGGAIGSSLSANSSKTMTSMMGGNASAGYSRTSGKSVTQETYNKSAEYCEKLCDHFVQRLNSGKNLGFWNTGIYLMADNSSIQARGAGQLRALMSGGETHWEPVRSNRLPSESRMKYIENFKNPRFNTLEFGIDSKEILKVEDQTFKVFEFLAKKFKKKINEVADEFRKSEPEKQERLLEEARASVTKLSDEDLEAAWEELKAAEGGHPFGRHMSGLGTPINSEELSIIMNPPRMDTQGVTVRQAASFGANYPNVDNERSKIDVGNIVIKRNVDPHLKFTVDTRDLCKHGFICGVTGSGKTNTCMHLLSQLDVPFMVIEPAKNEYRQLLKESPEIQVFTLGSEKISPFRINPFEFAQGSEILTHIDRLKSVFNAAFPMYASMPYLLEEAILDVYLDRGWELPTSTNRYFDVNDGSDGWHDYLPCLEDLLEKIDEVVLRKQYAQELSMDLSAALKARISSLMVGSKGLLFNTRKSTPLEGLLNNKVVLELRHLGDDDEKCFAMGLILSAIYEHLEVWGATQSELKHLVLIEEAHRLLKHAPQVSSMEVSNPQGKAVETFTNMISEIRAYGTGVLVVDQIPAKLTPDIIKNTNLKLVHRTLALDDRESVGATMGLTKAQGEELPRLKVGEVVAHREGWDKAFLVKVPYAKDEDSGLISNDGLAKYMESFHQKQADLYCRVPGMEHGKNIVDAYNRQDFRKFNPTVYRYTLGFILASLSLGTDAVQEMKKLSQEAITKAVGTTSEEVIDAWWIHYLKTFFTELSRSYPMKRDEVQLCHRLMVKQWFEVDGIDVSSQELDEGLKRLTKLDDAKGPLFRWIENAEKHKEKLNEALFGESMDIRMQQMDVFLTQSISTIFVGLSLGGTQLHELKVSYLEHLLTGVEGKEDILKRFKERKQSNV